MTTIIHALHGFLGSKSSWQLHKPAFEQQDKNLIFRSHDLLKFNCNDFYSWANDFNKQVESAQNILLGYSLGARLGMHAIIDQPHKWKAAILVSGHVGCKTESEKIKRLQDDQKWADRFEHENIETVLKDWNNQKVFSDLKSNLSQEFTKDQLIFLKEFSRAKQKNLKESIENLDMPILWITGELDHNFSNEAAELKLKSKKSRIKIVKNAAHRVPWENPSSFKTLVFEFIREVLA